MRYILTAAMILAALSAAAQEEKPVEVYVGQQIEVSAYVQQDSDAHDVTVTFDWPEELEGPSEPPHETGDALVLTAIAPTDGVIGIDIVDYTVLYDGHEVEITDVDNPDGVDIDPEPQTLHIRITTPDGQEGEGEIELR